MAKETQGSSVYNTYKIRSIQGYSAWRMDEAFAETGVFSKRDTGHWNQRLQYNSQCAAQSCIPGVDNVAMIRWNDKPVYLCCRYTDMRKSRL